MRTVLPLLILLAMGTAHANADVKVAPCPKNPQILLVQVGGESAINIFRAFASRLNMKPVDLINIQTNGMLCSGSQFSADGDVTAAKCSFLMQGQKNIPYPQIDPGYSGEERIVCE